VDPFNDSRRAAAQALAIDQAKGRVGQYSANIGAAQDALAMNETVLAQVTSLLQDVRTLAVDAGGTTQLIADGGKEGWGDDIFGKSLYGVAYAVGNVLLAIWGTVIVALMA
jgi:hypothetical protein